MRTFEGVPYCEIFILNTMEFIFYFDLNVTRVTDEYLSLNHKEDGEMEGCLRVYHFGGVYRRYDCEDHNLSKKLLKNPTWSASFNHDEEEICINNDLDDITLTKEICFEAEDWDDYEDIEPVMEILYQGDFYRADEFLETVSSHDLEFIYDNCNITSVDAELKKVECNDEEVEIDELLKTLS